jgi:hypothetical protein
MAQSTDTASFRIVDSETEELLSGSNPVHDEDHSPQSRLYQSPRVEPLWNRLGSRFNLRRKSTWFPMYELESRGNAKSRTTNIKFRWSMCVNIFVFSLTLM